MSSGSGRKEPLLATQTRKKPAPLRKPATLDHLRKARTVSRVVSFGTEDIPEPEKPGLSASEADKKAYEAAYEQWKAQVEEAAVEFVVTSLSRKRYRQLLEDHPATEEQIAEAKDRADPKPSNNSDTFGPALIAESITEPEGVTLEDAQSIWDNWPAGEIIGYGGLVTQLVMLNEQSRLEYHQGKSGGTRG